MYILVKMFFFMAGQGIGSSYFGSLRPNLFSRESRNGSTALKLWHCWYVEVDVWEDVDVDVEVVVYGVVDVDVWEDVDVDVDVVFDDDDVVDVDLMMLMFM